LKKTCETIVLKDIEGQLIYTKNIYWISFFCRSTADIKWNIGHSYKSKFRLLYANSRECFEPPLMGLGNYNMDFHSNIWYKEGELIKNNQWNYLI
jgi:hypothetical protein